jgi:hypothetical protein
MGNNTERFHTQADAMWKIVLKAGHDCVLYAADDDAYHALVNMLQRASTPFKVYFVDRDGSWEFYNRYVVDVGMTGWQPHWKGGVSY